MNPDGPALPASAPPCRRRVAAARQKAARRTPDLLAAAVFLAGAQLLLSGSLPAASGRLEALHKLLSLPLIEASHFLASLAGAGLLLLGHALQRRLDGAWLLAMLLLAGAALLSLARGGDYEHALVLATVGILLWTTRRQFRRQSSLLAQSFSLAWFTAAAVVVLATGWLLWFAHVHQAATAQAWWAYALDAESARALRSSVGAATLLSTVALRWMLHPAPPALVRPSAAQLERARAIADRSPLTYAQLVLRGDKALLFDTVGDSFLMYGRSGRSWVAMGDPVGTPVGARELRRRFRALCERHDGWCVFFEVHEEQRADYRELGLVLTPLGEQGRVELADFSLDGPRRRKLRQSRARLLREGGRFELVPPELVPALLPQLAEVSQAWLAHKTTREKGFSTASFDAGYLSRFPVAVVRQGERVVAFANVWQGAGREELSIDLMRHLPQAPQGTMDYLFTELLLWGRAQGYRWFDFGMAPLAGLEHRRDTPVWGRLASLLYRHGEHFYNFRGLRRFKAKFDPVWTTLYMASPGGVALPAVLVDVTALVAGSLPGVVTRLGRRAEPRAIASV